MNLVECKYSKGPNLGIEDSRWVDPNNGKVYSDRHGACPAHTVYHYYQERIKAFANSSGGSVLTPVPATPRMGTPNSANVTGDLGVLGARSIATSAINTADAVNPKTAQGNKKYSLRLLPLPAEVEVCRALEDGVVKYGAANWREKGVPASVYVDAAQRHIKQWFDGGQERASDSGVHNLGHAMACLAILIDAQWNETLGDDRPTPCRDTDALLLRVKP